MEKIERATEKRIFTTYDIYEKIVNNIQTLPGIKWEVQQYNYLYVVHKVISHINLHKDDDDRGCKINEEHLAILFGKSNSATADIFRNLIEWNILSISFHPTKGNSTRYLLHPDHADDRILIFIVPNKDVAFIDKLIKYEKEQQAQLKQDKFIDKSLAIINSSLSINANGYDYLNNKYNLFNSNDSMLLLVGYASLESAFLVSKSQLLDIKNKKKLAGGYGIERRDMPLFLILIKEFTCKRPPDRNGNKSRVYNNLTNLPREHRQYIHFCGKPLIMTDISNSQILLTVPIVEKYYKINSGKGAVGMPDDIIKFKAWAESGEFYENFSKLIYHGNSMTGVQRIELKIMIFRVLWFGRNTRFKNHNRVKSLFIKHFPNVYKIMTALKKADYRQFSIELQRFEASILIDKVAKKMLVRTPVLTLHDAIICTDTTMLQEAENRITAAFAKHGIKPKFKREDENKYTDTTNGVNMGVEAIVSPRPQLSLKKVFMPLKKRLFPPRDEEWLAQSRKYYASLTKEQVVANYEKYEGKKFPKKYWKWLENR